MLGAGSSRAVRRCRKGRITKLSEVVIGELIPTLVADANRYLLGLWRNANRLCCGSKEYKKEVSPGGVTVNMTNSVLSFFVIASITWFSPTVVGLILLSRRKKRIAVVPPRNL